MQANRDGIEQLATDIAGAMAITRKLEGYSSNIGNILEVIRGMAEQTNLLALNAAIRSGPCRGGRAGLCGGGRGGAGAGYPFTRGDPGDPGDDRQPAGDAPAMWRA